MKNFVFFCILMTNLSLSIFGFSNEREVRVYDCFPFLNEIELLKVRLNELNDVVDYFVIVENPLTQSGREKPLFFEDNKEQFSKFLHKIIHVVGPERKSPEYSDWDRENEQRNDVLLGLKDAKDDDIVIVSDVDEIVRKEKIQEIKEMIKSKKDPIRLCLKMYRFFLNRKDKKMDMWPLAYVSSYKTLKQHSPETLRTKFPYSHSINDAGWHFSGMGYIDRYAYKIESGAHQEVNTERYKRAYKLIKWARKRCRLVKIDEKNFPKYIVDNFKYFEERNFIDNKLPPNWKMRVFNKRQKALNDKLIVKK
ncbi:MAG: hypothetical protein K1060chlam1_01503 [Candidatus Anoxychlamydiales bacterium]|nr:hypothetical protein [Candidatus Anoxychlamydiales bacterium]